MLMSSPSPGRSGRSTTSRVCPKPSLGISHVGCRVGHPAYRQRFAAAAGVARSSQTAEGYARRSRLGSGEKSWQRMYRKFFVTVLGPCALTQSSVQPKWDLSNWPQRVNDLASASPADATCSKYGRTTEFFSAASMRRSVARWNAAFMRQNGGVEGVAEVDHQDFVRLDEDVAVDLNGDCLGRFARWKGKGAINWVNATVVATCTSDAW